MKESSNQETRHQVQDEIVLPRSMQESQRGVRSSVLSELNACQIGLCIFTGSEIKNLKSLIKDYYQFKSLS